MLVHFGGQLIGRGREIDEQSLAEFVRGLELPQSVRDELLKLTPARYLGNAGEQTRKLD